MKENQHIPLHNNWLKCLLLLPLIISFVSSSGYAESLYSPQPQKASVELLLTARPINKKGVSFTKALANVHQPASFVRVYHAFFQELVLQHDRLLKVCFTEYGRQLLFFPASKRMAHQKIIPRSSDEDLFNFCNG